VVSRHPGATLGAEAASERVIGEQASEGIGEGVEFVESGTS
jgi:hypothetical protein